MTNLLNVDENIQIKSGTIRVGNFISGNSSSELYSAKFGSSDYLVKVLYNKGDEELLELLEELPNELKNNSKFSFPIETSSINKLKTGEVFYLIKPISQNYKSLDDIIFSTEKIKLEVKLAIAIQIIETFKTLHKSGYCFTNISLKNIFCHKKVDVIFVDSIEVTAKFDRKKALFSKNIYMAPEVLKNDALTNLETDLFSLALILFYLFFASDPFEGEEYLKDIFDFDKIQELHCDGNSFVFNPNYLSNKPSEKYQAEFINKWNSYPDYFKTMFIEIFTIGVNDPEARFTEERWLQNIKKLYDELFYCKYCNFENFYDNNKKECFKCKKTIEPLRRIIIKFPDNPTESFILSPNKKLYNYLTGTFFAEVNINPEHKDVSGLKNLSDEKWTATIGDSQKEIEKDKTIKISDNLKLNFGNYSGEIQNKGGLPDDE